MVDKYLRSFQLYEIPIPLFQGLKSKSYSIQSPFLYALSIILLLSLSPELIKEGQAGNLGTEALFRMKNWAAPLIASGLFAFLSPGLVFQMPGKERPVGFMNMKTSVASIFLHAVIYGLLIILFLVILDIRIYAQGAAAISIVILSKKRRAVVFRILADQLSAFRERRIQLCCFTLFIYYHWCCCATCMYYYYLHEFSFVQ